MRYWANSFTTDYGDMGDISFPETGVLSKTQKDNLEMLLLAPTCHIMPMMKKVLEHKYDFITDGDNYLMGIPKQNASNVMFVAHVDVVAAVKADKKLIWESPNLVRADKSALGADDRAGVFVIYEAVKGATENLPYILLTNYEETGGKGVSQFCKKEKLPKGVHFMVEFDRQGFNEYVVYSHTFPDNLKAMMTKLGYEKKHGSFSDVSTLTDTFDIAHINLCVGYSSQHTENENLSVSELMRTVSTASVIMNTKFPSPIKVPKKVLYAAPTKTRSYWYDEEALVKCAYCNSKMYTVYHKDEDGDPMCWSCRNKGPDKSKKVKKSIKQSCGICGAVVDKDKITVIEGLLVCDECSTYFGTTSDDDFVYPKDDDSYSIRVVDGKSPSLLDLPFSTRAGGYAGYCDCCGYSTALKDLRKITYSSKTKDPKSFFECNKCLAK
jgi:hypothetical protein